MNDEKQIILKMLKEGKISVEEASDLLSACSENKSKTDKLTQKITGAVDSIIKKATDTIQGFDIDQAMDFGQYNVKGEYNTHKDLRIEDDINEINIDIVSGTIEIEKSDEEGIYVKSDVWAKKPDLNDFIDCEIEEDKLSIFVNDTYNNVQATSDITLSLGKDVYDKVQINQVNGKVEISDVDFADLGIDTVNGKIQLINLSANTRIKNTNGKIDVKNVRGALSIDNINGPIYLTNIEGEEAEIYNINGNIRIDGLASKNLDASSNAGTIRIFNIENTEDIKLKSGFGNIVVDTTDFSGDIRANVESKAINITEKFAHKIQDAKGYEISTAVDNSDLNINIKSGFGKVSLR